MIRWATFSPRGRLREWLPVASIAACGVMIGCGSGGGRVGNPPVNGVCGSPPGSAVPTLCGRVVNDSGGAAVAGATVQLRNAADAVVAQTTTVADGSYKFNNVNRNTVVAFRVNAANFFPGLAKYQGATYDYSRRNQADTASCQMVTGAIPAGDKDLGTVSLFPDTGPPPAPVFICPK